MQSTGGRADAFFRRADQVLMKTRILAVLALGAAAAGCRMCSNCCDCSPPVTEGPWAAYATMPGAQIPAGVLNPRTTPAPAAPPAGTLAPPQSPAEQEAVEDSGKPAFQAEQDEASPNPEPPVRPLYEQEEDEPLFQDEE